MKKTIKSTLPKLVQPLRLSSALLVLALTAPVADAGPEAYSVHTKRSSSAQNPAYLDRAEYADVITRLDRLRKKLEEWGSVTASAPVVFREKGQFSLDKEVAHKDDGTLDLKKMDFPTTEEYMTAAATNASGRAVMETARAFGNSLNAEISPVVSATAGLKPGATPAPAAGPTPPTPPTKEELVPETLTLTNKVETNTTSTVEANKDFADKLKITSTQSVILGANAKLAELTMRQMADPEKRAFTNPGKTLHLAIVEVSCNPGWRTKENYIADITASCEYYDSRSGRVVSEAEGRRPVVFSVLPLLDAQTLELQNTQREVTELMASISAAFPTQAANFRLRDVMKFIKDYRSTVATKTPKTISNSYSSGNQFGFRFSPSLVAIKDPAQKGSPSANILQSTVLPVLVMFVVDQGWVETNNLDSVMVHVSNRWMLNERPPLRTFWKRFMMPMERETTFDRMTLAQEVRLTGEKLENVFGGVHNRQPISPDVPAEYLALRRDLNELSSKIVGSSHVVFAFRERNGRNDPDHPVITSVFPSVIPAGCKTRLAIWGEFIPQDAEVYVGGIAGQDLKIDPKGRQLTCNVTIPAECANKSDKVTVIVESASGTFDYYEDVTLAKAAAAEAAASTPAKK